jgi:hydrogenase maturation protease
MVPVKVLQTARDMGSTIEHILIVGCEPGPLVADDELRMQMSAPVQAAVDEAITVIHSLVNQILMADT